MELENYAYDQDKDGKYLDRPIKEFDHCLVAGTMVLTDHGEAPIEDISEGDMVLTHLGYRRVTASGITQLEQPIWKLELVDGTVLEGTWNHPVVTVEGVKRLSTLTEDDIVVKQSVQVVSGVSVGRMAPDEAFGHADSPEDSYTTRATFVRGHDQSACERVKEVTLTDRAEDVYDLTVEEAHDFFANGMLVLNCMDGLRYGMARFFISGKGKVVEAKGMDALPAGPSTGSRRVGSTSGPISGTRSKWVASSK